MLNWFSIRDRFLEERELTEEYDWITPTGQGDKFTGFIFYEFLTFDKDIFDCRLADGVTFLFPPVFICFESKQVNG